MLIAALSNSRKHLSKNLLVSAYGADLHGPLRERTAKLPPPEPFDLWLACRNAVAPFRENAIVVGDEDFCSRASKHFANVISPFSLSSSSSSASPALKENDSAAFRPAVHLQQLNERGSSNSALQFHQSSVLGSSLIQNALGQLHEHQSLLLQRRREQEDRQHASSISGSAHHQVTSKAAAAASSSFASADICVVQLTSTSIPLHDLADLHAVASAFVPFLRPHGALCITGTVLPGELLCSGRLEALKSDFDDAAAWLVDGATPGELFSSGFHFLSPEGQKQVEVVANSAGPAPLVNTALHCFEAEYSLLGDAHAAAAARGGGGTGRGEADSVASLCALFRSMPSYRRRCGLRTDVDEHDGVVSRRAKRAVSQKASAAADMRESGDKNQPDFSDEVDPVDCFEELARLRLLADASSRSNPDALRLRVMHWMWVCDRRPRSRDSVTLRLPGIKKGVVSK